MFTFELASIILFPFISMMQVEAYMLVSGNNNPELVVKNDEEVLEV
jgi:hypothetical protein